MLAQSAARGGYASVALDLFADQDTRKLANDCYCVADAQGAFDEKRLFSALSGIPNRIGLVYGSGLDGRPDLLGKLIFGRRLLGNSIETLRWLKTPRRFFALLKELEIPHPATRFSPPPSSEGWLVKPSCGEGGKRVRFNAKNLAVAETDYFQRYVPRDAGSVLFLADSQQARIIGFNSQWNASHDPDQPFLFGGAVNRASLNPDQEATLQTAIAKLTRAVGLVGLNSLDFIRDESEIRVLEVNPRPSATMALYDADYPRGLVHEHVLACQGRLPPSVCKEGPVRAFRIAYATRPILIPPDMNWPEGSADLPAAGSEIAVGYPICSVQVEGMETSAVDAALQTRITELLARLGPN